MSPLAWGRGSKRLSLCRGMSWSGRRPSRGGVDRNPKNGLRIFSSRSRPSRGGVDRNVNDLVRGLGPDSRPSRGGVDRNSSP